MTMPKKTSAWGGALLVGLATGVATGLFLRSDRGQEMTDEARKRAKVLQKQLLRKLRTIRHLTKEKYAEVVHEIVSHYEDTKELAASQLTDLRERLMEQWEDIREQLQTESDADRRLALK